MGTANLAFLIISVILAIAATVLGFIFILPEKRRKSLNGFGKFIHDLFNFKFLIVEKMLQALYVFSTLFMIVFGFFSLFSFRTVNYNIFTGETVTKWDGGRGLVMMILGPIVLRIVYELLLMTIIAVKHIGQINAKLKNQNDEVASDSFKSLNFSEYKSAPAANNAPAFCPKCGSKMQNGSCSNPECK